MTEYSTKYVWRDMECDNPKVIWRHLIWFAQCIPWHSFVLWMAIQNRLMTQDRVAVWKPNEPMKCVLCDQCPDSHDHLFFACSYSSLVWNEMLKTLSKELFQNGIILKETQECISKSKEMKKALFKETVRLRMMSFIVKESKAVRRMEEIWNVKVARAVLKIRIECFSRRMS
nr:reverse transcriptase zinc-binding domain-containing protein [Tanacetum cinerariifolium]